MGILAASARRPGHAKMAQGGVFVRGVKFINAISVQHLHRRLAGKRVRPLPLDAQKR